MELVVVIAILGILAGLAIPRFMDATTNARGAKTVADLRTLESAAVMYYAKTGVVPTKDNLENGNATLGTTALVASWPVPAPRARRGRSAWIRGFQRKPFQGGRR